MSSELTKSQQNDNLPMRSMLTLTRTRDHNLKFKGLNSIIMHGKLLLQSINCGLGGGGRGGVWFTKESDHRIRVKKPMKYKNSRKQWKMCTQKHKGTKEKKKKGETKA